MLSWQEVIDLAHKVGVAIKKSGFVPDYLIGITSDGLIPLGLLSAELGIKKILTVSAHSYQGTKKGALEITYLPEIVLTGKKILLIDEMSETGDTLMQLSKVIREKYQPLELRTATLTVNVRKSQCIPDYYGRAVQDWTTFPWQKH